MSEKSPVEYARCDLCESTKQRRMPRFYIFQDTACYHVRCRRCGLIYVNPRPQREYIETMYPPEYFQGGGYVGGLSAGGDFSRFDRILAVMKRLLPLNALLLEIGCADGLFLSKAQENGWRVKGVEISPVMAEYARARRKVDVFTGALPQMAAPQRMFDCIYMGDVLEHLYSPKEILLECGRILRDDGILILDVPLFYNTFYSWISSMYLSVRRTVTGKAHRMEGPPHHLYEFVPATLKNLLTACGFAVKEFPQRGNSDRILIVAGKRRDNTDE